MTNVTGLTSYSSSRRRRHRGRTSRRTAEIHWATKRLRGLGSPEPPPPGPVACLPGLRAAQRDDRPLVIALVQIMPHLHYYVAKRHDCTACSCTTPSASKTASHHPSPKFENVAAFASGKRVRTKATHSAAVATYVTLMRSALANMPAVHQQQ